MTDLHVKYRPPSFDGVIGQDEVVKSLRRVLERDPAHAYLFTGPAGVGKTTLARIVSSELGCESASVLEIDAATHTGIDAMRSVTENSRFVGFGESINKAIIIDEAHALSRQAFLSLLKSLEEPPDHVHWMLCTTEPGKIPKTIQTRCLSYNLKPVPVDDIFSLVETIAKEEEIDIDEDILDLISKEAQGSPRQALVYLSMCDGCTSRKEAAILLRTVQDNKDVFNLCQLLIKGTTWKKATKIIKALEDTNAESIRLIVTSYISKVAMGAKNENQVQRCLAILDAFSEPCNTNDKMAPILLALGRILFEEEEEEENDD